MLLIAWLITIEDFIHRLKPFSILESSPIQTMNGSENIYNSRRTEKNSAYLKYSKRSFKVTRTELAVCLNNSAYDSVQGKRISDLDWNSGVQLL